MEQGDGGEPDVVGAGDLTGEGEHLLEVGAQVPVAEHCGTGGAGRSRGEEQGGWILRAPVDHDELVVAAHLRGGGLEAPGGTPERVGERLVAQDDRGLEAG